MFGVFLVVHGAGVHFKWYQHYRYFDIVTHFLGGLALSAFIKIAAIALFLMVIWEIIEMLLVVKGKKNFKETFPNKLRDLLLGSAGYFMGLYFFGA